MTAELQPLDASRTQLTFRAAFEYDHWLAAARAGHQPLRQAEERRRPRPAEAAGRSAVVVSKGEYLGEFEQLVLLALIRLEDKAYGMAVRREIEDRADRDVSIGAVYATLDRLEEKGLVKSRLGEPSDTVAGGPRNALRLPPPAPGLERSQQAVRQMLDVAGTVEPEPMTPPRIASWLLEASLLSLDGEAIAGDLHEEFCAHIVPARGVFRARWWYRWQVARSLAPLYFRSWQRASLFRASVAIVGAGFTAVVPATLLVMLRTHRGSKCRSRRGQSCHSRSRCCSSPSPPSPRCSAWRSRCAC